MIADLLAIDNPPAVGTWVGLITALIGAAALIGVAMVNSRVKVAATDAASAAKDAKQANIAVNHVEDGAPTLIQRVDIIGLQVRTDRVWMSNSLFAIAQQIGVRLPPSPPEFTEAPTVPGKDAAL